MSEEFIYFDKGPDGDAAVFAAPSEMIVARTPGEVPAAFDAMARAQAAGRWLAGFASYELGYALMPKLAARLPERRDTPLVCFGVFDGPSSDLAQRFVAGALGAPASLAKPAPMWDFETYRAAFDQVKDYIAAGDIYQANLTFPIEATLSGSAVDLYLALQKLQPVSFGAYVDLGVGPRLLSRSPELFFRVDAAGVIETRPMKGTAARGATTREDAVLRDALAGDVKNRAENLMIVDLLRNDIGKVAQIGSVTVPELFTIETYATVHQMTSLVRAQLRDNVGLAELFEGLFPCGSITGAPKLRSMQILRDLEPDPRGAYCGAIGWAAPDGSAAFNVAIRTLSVFDDGRVRFNVGGGIVYDSTAASEYEEALWKARFTNLPPTG